jgi:hypothetical protein
MRAANDQRRDPLVGADQAWFTKSNTSTAGIRSLGDLSISKKAFGKFYKNDDKCKYLQLLKMK